VTVGRSISDGAPVARRPSVGRTVGRRNCPRADVQISRRSVFFSFDSNERAKIQKTKIHKTKVGTKTKPKIGKKKKDN
jgi:hypothetical protein